MKNPFDRASSTVLLAGMLGASLATAQDVSILFTADNAGSVGPCPVCPERTGEGGLARRATALAQARSAAPDLFLLDAGDAIYGPESIESGGKVVVAAYNALAYDAVAVTYRDFQEGKAAGLALWKEAKFAPISANLVDAATGAPLVKPFVVLGSGARQTAVVSVSEPPAGLQLLPRLQRQLEGIRIRPPVDALREHLPAAKKTSPRVVLLYHGTGAGLASVLEAFPSDFSAVIIAGLKVEHLPAAGKPATLITGAADRGREVGRITLRAGATGTANALEPIRVDPTLPADAAVEALVASYSAPAPEPMPQPAEAAAASAIPSEPVAEKSYRLELAGESRGVHVAVLSATFLPTYGELEAAKGSQWLVLDTEWENIIPLTLIEERKLATEYRIPELGDHLYLVVDGQRVERLLPGAATLAGHVPVKDFRLERLGSRLRGNVIFSVPSGPIQSLDLRFYDYAHGHVAIALRVPETPVLPAKPVSPLEKNEVLEVAAYGIEKAADLAGTAPPAGMELIWVDLRARSLFTLDGDATAFDPKARPGARLKIGTVADWLESRRYVQLVADGEHAFAPLPGSTLAEEPRFLPDVATGGRLLFRVPTRRESLELRCDFPNAKSSAGNLFRPKGMTIPLEGKRPRLEARKPLVAIADDVFQVAITGVSASGELLGVLATEGQRFVTLDVTVSNTGKKGEHFQSPEQLKLALPDGTLLSIDPLALEGPRPPLPLVWIPPSERRTFQAPFRVPAAESRLRLAYAGVSLQKTVDLPAVEAAPPVPAPAAAAAAAAEAEPKEKSDPPAAEKKAEPVKPSAAAPAKPVTSTPGAAAAATAIHVPRVPKGLAGVGLTPEKVNEAIDRGAEFLWSYVKEKDFKTSYQKLGDVREHWITSLALVHAGAHKKFPDFDAKLRSFLSAIDPTRGDIYQAGITCMLVEAYGDPSFFPTLRSATRYILEVQGAQGSWNYSRSLPTNVMQDPAASKAILVSGGIPLDGAELAPAMARVSDWKEGVDGDNSVSQYAILGLQAASRSGVPVSAEVWKRCLECIRSRQGEDGNWCYTGKCAEGYGSMTCAGLSSIAITRHESGEKNAAGDPAIEKGLEWLGRHFSVTGHPELNPPNHWFFYYLYALERVGRILDIDFIGTHEWYPEGAQQLLSTQVADGSWVGYSEEADPRLATSFALLFLTRSTPSLKPQEVARGGSGILKTGIQLPDGGRYYLILDASGSMTAQMDGKTKWQVAQDAVSVLINELSDTCDVALRVYGHRKRAIEDDASEDTALEIPMQRLEKKTFLAKIEALRPRGKTPLARSLLEATRDLSGTSEASPVTVVLLTDGGEDTLPRQDPVRAAAEFAELKGIRFHVIGFDIGRQDWSAQLQSIAQTGKGSYWPAMKAETLYAELRSAVFGIPESFAVVTKAGKEATRGAFGAETKLPEGSYVFLTDYAGERYEETFWINMDRTTSVVFNAAQVAKVKPKNPGARVAPTSGERKAEPAAPKSRFCTECGKPMKAEAKFCSSCGAKAKQ